MPATATLQDVADRAGVHQSTVALALRDSPRISADTRQRVQAIAREIGYQLNPLVAALMSARRSGHIVKHAESGLPGPARRRSLRPADETPATLRFASRR